MRYLLAILALPLSFVGCNFTPAPYSPDIDEAFVQAVAMQWEFGESTVKSTVKTSGNHFPDSTKMVQSTDEYERIDKLPFPFDAGQIAYYYKLYHQEVDTVLSANDELSLGEAVLTVVAMKQVERACKQKQSAAAEGESTPAVDKGSPPPAAARTRPLFYEIILHTGKDCAPCDRLKHELKVRGYPFTEHLVSKGTVPTAFIDGEEFVGDAIYNRLKIVKLNRKDSP